MNILQSVSSSQVSLLTINFQRLLCTVSSMQVVEEAVLYLVQDFRFNVQFIDS